MKKIVYAVISLLFVFASLFGFAGTVDFATQASDGEPNDTQSPFPSGISVRYSDSNDQGTITTELNPEDPDKYIRHHDRFGALYNTSGYLVISGTENAGGKLGSLNVSVVRYVDLADEQGIPVDVSEDTDDYGRLVYSWEYDSMGKYGILISMGYDEKVHEFGPSCVKIYECEEEHEHDENCETEYEFVCSYKGCGHCGDCDICKPDYTILEYEFLSVCKNSEPDFGATFTYNNNLYTEVYNLASGTKFEVRARVKDANFYWDETSVIYKSDCDLLTVSGDGKYLVLQKASAGVHTIAFNVTFDFVSFDENGAITQSQKTIPVSFNITFFKNPKQTDIWDLLLGAAVLLVLAGAAFLATKFSKNVERR